MDRTQEVGGSSPPSSIGVPAIPRRVRIERGIGFAGSATGALRGLVVDGVEVKAEDRGDSFGRHQVGASGGRHGEPVDEGV
jgi:hypothetical protein